LARQVKEAGGETAKIGASVSTANSPTQQVESLSVIASGLEFSDDGSLVAVNEEHRSKLAKQLKDLAQGPGASARFAKGVKTCIPGRANRTTAVPFSAKLYTKIFEIS
jgi:hypothetical protein